MGGICWIASYPKSGNTWLRIFLKNLLFEDSNAEEINQLKIIQFQDTQVQWYQMAAGHSIQHMSEKEIFKLTPRAQQIISQQIPDTIFVKTHSLLGLQMWNTPSINQEVTAGAICVVRNPLDVVISLDHHFGVHDLDQSISFLNKDLNRIKGTQANIGRVIGSWRQQVESWSKMQPEYLHVTRYEDMLHEPVDTFERVNKFIGANKSLDVLKRAIDQSSFKKLQSIEKKEGFADKSAHATSFFRSGKSDQWKKLLSEDQIKAIVEANYDTMKKYDYIPDKYK